MLFSTGISLHQPFVNNISVKALDLWLIAVEMTMPIG